METLKTVQLYRTHTVESLLECEACAEVVLSGWVQRRRDFGRVVFVDLRDRSGIVQLVFDQERGTPFASMSVAEQLRSEFVVNVRGHVVARTESAVNAKLATGHIEIVVLETEIINSSKNPPFYIQDGIEVDETLRLRHRYLDLRRPEMQQMLMLRHKVTRALRTYLDAHGFIETETPILTKSTPEGARDYLVPSRLQAGEFYALPQSPQLFKQLLMVAGFERYYQIARCFRDEDLRADRQPEFTQLDIEMSFLPLDVFQAMMEEMIASVFKSAIGMDVPTPFERMPYHVAMERYGSDKPDLRFEMPIEDIEECVEGTEFRVFVDALAQSGVIKALVAPACADFSRKQVDTLTEFVGRYGVKGLATIAVQAGAVKSSIAKFLTAEQLTAIVEKTGAKDGDLILIAAADKSRVLQAFGALRAKLGTDLGLVKPDTYKFLWVTEFPLLGYDEEAGRYVAEHHPFTMPVLEDLPLLKINPGAVRAQAYDLVLNGFEIGGGSMRIYRREIQEQMFEMLGFTPEEARRQFGFLLEAFEYGTPPHGGIAFGIDRIIMIMGGRKSLRDGIAFPKTASATDVMMQAPSTVAQAQLDTLHLAVRDDLK